MQTAVQLEAEWQELAKRIVLAPDWSTTSSLMERYSYPLLRQLRAQEGLEILARIHEYVIGQSCWDAGYIIGAKIKEFEEEVDYWKEFRKEPYDTSY